MSPLRVLIVEDSPTIRAYLRNALEPDEGLECVGEAGTARDAISLCAALRPDVISMDLALPGQSGVDATEHIMAYTPTPILVVSAADNRGISLHTYDALSAGAVDVLEKPGPQDLDQSEVWGRRFRSALKLVARIKVLTHPKARLRGMSGPATAQAEAPPGERRTAALVAVGASTGGPAAVRELLAALPPSFHLPILLVIHISAGFSVSLAQWLERTSGFAVRFAVHGAPVPRSGERGVWMAPADRHLVIRSGHVLLSAEAPRHSCRPSIDVLFESVAYEMGARSAGVLLTGMGRDGADGLLAMRRAGAWTAAQDEASSIVFGMPKEAIRLGAAERVRPPLEIAEALNILAERTGGPT